MNRYLAVYYPHRQHVQEVTIRAETREEAVAKARMAFKVDKDAEIEVTRLLSV